MSEHLTISSYTCIIIYIVWIMISIMNCMLLFILYCFYCPSHHFWTYFMSILFRCFWNQHQSSWCVKFTYFARFMEEIDVESKVKWTTWKDIIESLFWFRNRKIIGIDVFSRILLYSSSFNNCSTWFDWNCVIFWKYIVLLKLWKYDLFFFHVKS